MQERTQESVMIEVPADLPESSDSNQKNIDILIQQNQNDSPFFYNAAFAWGELHLALKIMTVLAILAALAAAIFIAIWFQPLIWVIGVACVIGSLTISSLVGLFFTEVLYQHFSNEMDSHSITASLGNFLSAIIMKLQDSPQQIVLQVDVMQQENKKLTQNVNAFEATNNLFKEQVINIQSEAVNLHEGSLALTETVAQLNAALSRNTELEAHYQQQIQHINSVNANQCHLLQAKIDSLDAIQKALCIELTHTKKMAVILKKSYFEVLAVLGKSQENITCYSEKFNALLDAEEVSFKKTEKKMNKSVNKFNGIIEQLDKNNAEYERLLEAEHAQLDYLVSLGILVDESQKTMDVSNPHSPNRPGFFSQALICKSQYNPMIESNLLSQSVVY